MSRILEPRHTRALLRKMGVRDRTGFDHLDDTIYPVAGVEPVINELANAVHPPNAGLAPVTGIQWLDFSIVNPSNGQQLAVLNLTAGLYEITHLVTVSATMASAVTLGILMPSGTTRTISYLIAAFAAFRLMQPITVHAYIDEMWTGTLPQVGVTLATGFTGTVAGYLTARRCWSESTE